MHLDQVAVDLEKKAFSIGLKINVKRTKVYSLLCHYTLPIFINGQNIENEQSVCIESINSSNNSTELDLTPRNGNIDFADQYLELQLSQHQKQVEAVPR